MILESSINYLITDFHGIVNALYDAKVTKRWLEIGLFLGITFDHLQKLQEKSDDDKVREMVRFWINWNYNHGIFGKPSWKSLVRAIGAWAGGNNRNAANMIASDHQTRSATRKFLTKVIKYILITGCSYSN